MAIAGTGARTESGHQAILDTLETRLGPQRFNAWFRSTTRLDIDKDYVKLNVPNPFVASWIENHFLDDVEASIAQGLGEARPLMICVDASLSKQLRKRQLDQQATRVRRTTTGETRGGDLPANPPLRNRLETFVVGQSNQLAYSAALLVAGGQSAAYNPLFIHGASGVGKTHLLQGVCNAVGQRKGKPVRWRYVSGEQFTNEFVAAIKTKRLEAFRASYRHLDLLAIDDIHFLAAKRATQEEFLHTFNTIDAAGKQVIMASDTHPRMLGQLSEHLASRFVAGCVVKMDPPDRTTRLKILARKAALVGQAIPREVLEYIAVHIRGNVRELEGALVKLTALAGLSKASITLDMATDALAEHLAQTDGALTLGDIEALVAAYFGVTPADIHSSRRTHTVSLARMIAMTLGRRHTQMSYPEIARFMGKNHSSVVLAVQRMDRMIDQDGTCKWMTPSGPKTASARQLMAVFQDQLS
ncbi:MAG: chromosomal replication initiator protein DnaA [Planctomycetes bacterium]|nr:chromosomal replication initiator protein DnaA [Planctomycetota bacterium]